MVLRIFASIMNVPLMFVGGDILFGHLGLLTPPVKYDFDIAGILLLYFICPILNITAIWWRTESRARCLRIILRILVTIGNGLIFVLGLYGVYLLLSPGGFTRYLAVFSLTFLIWPTLNCIAIWWGRRKPKRKAAPEV